MERVRLTPPDERRARGEKARLYIRWMPRLGAEAVALYELLRALPDAGIESVETVEMAELLRTTPERAGDALQTLLDNGFATGHEGWIEVHPLPPGSGSPRRATDGPRQAEETPEAEQLEQLEEPRESQEPQELREREAPEESGAVEAAPGAREIEIVRAEPEGVSADDYFRYMGSLPAPHILEFLNGYCGRDGVEPDVVREALRIASERDARKMGYVRSILERWVERGVKTVADVELFEQDRKLRLVAEGGSGGSGGSGGYDTPQRGREVSDGTDRQPAAGFKEGYEWFFGE
ncbi:DnaD domain-containing protein [Rubrobacter aplysinae]|uniref:DnaD domain-containing protein n=1 Tax=Rubrobacter aplysinae TaxID=909625 RepID=UPI00064C0FF3|nr:DnaD domain protein [Rubrobacter aplysinae]